LSTAVMLATAHLQSLHVLVHQGAVVAPADHDGLSQELLKVSRQIQEVGRVHNVLKEQRNRLIRQAHVLGFSTRTIALLAGITHPRVVRILNHQQKGESP